ncbi:MAG TPA: hypothetical protein VNY05_09155 [Candidatus Acidoferrales bacterium]|jgi:hypothetical protein|nr:hypothetical protein [Candidatus Acidoferrales bacterium]
MKFYQFESTENGSAGAGVCPRTASPAEARHTAHNPQRGTLRRRYSPEGGDGKALQPASIAAALLVALAMAATAQTQVDLRTQSRNVDFSASSSTKPSKTGTTLPATCAMGETFLKTDAPAGKNLYVCTPANTWIVQGTPDAAGNADKVLSNDGATAAWRTMGGDVSGKPDALTVAKIQGQAVSATAPAAGQLLVWNALAGLWGPANPAFGLLSGTVTDGQVGTGINANKIGGGTVANSAFGYLAGVNSDIQAQLNGKAAANQGVAGDVSGNLGATKVMGLQNRNLAATAPSNGQALTWNSTTSQWEPQTFGAAITTVFGRTGAVGAQSGDYTFAQIAGTVADPQIGGGVNASKIGSGAVANTAFGFLANVTADVQTQINGKAALVHSHNAGGDASGDIGSMTVTALRNRTVASTLPTNGQTLVWNTSVSQWQPQTLAGGGGVPTVFGRTGAVIAQTGDYTFGQISGTVTDSQVAAAINATKIGGGTVGNVAFGYLSNVTADLQTQLNGKAVTNQPMGGDVSGTLGAVTVAALQNRTVASTVPINGQALVWNSSSSQWQPQNVAASGAGGAYSSSFTSQTTVIIPGSMHQLGTANLLVGCYDTSVPALTVQPKTVSVHPTLFDVTITFTAAQSGRCVVSSGGSGSGGSGGAGASMGSQLGDFNVLETTPTVLTIGQNCSAVTPCNVRWGATVYSFTSSKMVTLTAGSGTAYIYMDSNGLLTAGHNLTLTCTLPCAAVAGVTAFPVNSIPLFTWTATNGTWDVAGALDKRALLSGKTVNGGFGIVASFVGSATNIAVDTAAVPTYLTAAATLSFGSIANGACADSSFPLTGAAAGNSVAPGLPSGLEAGLMANMRVSSANTIAVRLCNLSGGTVSPASATYTGTIVRSF